MNRIFITVAGISGGLAVVLGAFAAHGLKSILSEDSLQIFHTAVLYHFIHTLALLGAGILSEKINSGWLKTSGYFFIAGILFFSGSLYLLSNFNTLTWLGPITPLGGLCFIIGWISLGVGSIRRNSVK